MYALGPAFLFEFLTSLIIESSTNLRPLRAFTKLDLRLTQSLRHNSCSQRHNNVRQVNNSYAPNFLFGKYRYLLGNEEVAPAMIRTRSITDYRHPS